MDVVTYTLAGFALGRAGLNRVSPQANAIVMLAANAPDIDLISLAGGDQTALEFHRGITHSVFALPLVALVPLLAVGIVWRGKMPWGRAWAVSAVGVAGHLMLDWSGVYGLRLLAPFREGWYHLDAVPETDIVITGVLLSVAAWAALARLVSAEIGAARTRGRAAALAGLLFISLWIGTRWMLHDRALAVVGSRLYGSCAPTRVAAFPHYANPLVWRGLVETAADYYLTDLNLREAARFDPSRSQRLFKTRTTEAISAAEGAGPVASLLAFARYPYWSVSPSTEAAGAQRIEVTDLSFGLPSDNRFSAVAVIGRDSRVLRAQFRFRARDEQNNGP